jgi:hypothetical protein
MMGAMSERLSTALWERSDRLFLEIGRLDREGDQHVLSGVVLYRGRGGPTSATYRIEVDDRWCTREVRLTLDEPAGAQTLSLTADGSGRWWRDGAPLDLPFPCLDVDLAISPSTNTLAIRRLDLGVGEAAVARVLWVQVPSFAARAVEQTYERVERTTYRYKGRFGSYRIDVDEHGVVVDYPGGGWRAAAHRAAKATAARRPATRR